MAGAANIPLNTWCGLLDNDIALYGLYLLIFVCNAKRNTICTMQGARPAPYPMENSFTIYPDT